ncbi:MAG: winged helix DNA-binding domain-containing protein [Candidatus Bathyarchaeota archaeon]|nr:MAG: winged helix DNA-binding domain-containing protein [Candidatus Bathyarchaeota archaeon]
MEQSAPDVPETYKKEAVKEFAIRRMRLTPETQGKGESDVLSVVRDIGGLQYGGHLSELFSRVKYFRPEWFEHLSEAYSLIEGHVLRGALRIVDAEEYPYYFKATRCVARRRRYQNCPAALNEDHILAQRCLDTRGPLTIQEFKELFMEEHPQSKSKAGRLLQDLYNHGEVARMGRKNQKPLFHTVEKLPYELEVSEISEKEAKEWLLLKCLSIHGPFTVGDIAHWVGWNLTEAKETLRGLISGGEVVNVNVEGDRSPNYLRAQDVPFLSSLADDLPEHNFVRILFNDDALLLGCYKRLLGYFGYQWAYPQFSEGVVWRAAILSGRNLIGEADVEMYSKSPVFRVRSLTMREDLADPDTLSRMEDTFRRHAEFRGKTLAMARSRLV